MRRLILFLLMALLTVGVVQALSLRTIFSSFTGKLDYVRNEPILDASASCDEGELLVVNSTGGFDCTNDFQANITAQACSAGQFVSSFEDGTFACGTPSGGG